VLSAEELLAGGSLTYEIEVPEEILHPGGNGRHHGAAPETHGRVVLRPLTVRDLQLITRAAKESDALTATLMVQRALVEPALSVTQVAGLHIGLVQFLLDRVNAISGIRTTEDELAGAAAAPLVKAALVLAQAYGWTPQQVQELTLGQVLLHMQLLKENAS
jgi:hypothetical protein